MSNVGLEIKQSQMIKYLLEEERKRIKKLVGNIHISPKLEEDNSSETKSKSYALIVNTEAKEINEEKKENKETSPFIFSKKTDDNTFVIVDNKPVLKSELKKEAKSKVASEKEIYDKINSLIKANLTNFKEYYLIKDANSGLYTLIVVRLNGYNQNYCIDPTGLCWGQGTDPRIDARINSMGEWTFCPLGWNDLAKKILADKFYCLTADEVKRIENRFLPASFSNYVDLHNLKQLKNKEKNKLTDNLIAAVNYVLSDNADFFPRFRLVYENPNKFSLVSDKDCISPLPATMSTTLKPGLTYSFDGEKVTKTIIEEVKE